MKHPDREELIPFVFGEATGETRKHLAEHLRQCPECSREVDGWRRSLGRMDAWSIPRPQRQPLISFEPFLKWALAAAIVLGLGFVAGRLTMPKPVDVRELRASVESSVRASLAAEFSEALQQVQGQSSNALTLAEARLTRASALENQQIWRAYMDVLNSARAEDGRAVRALLRQTQQQQHQEVVAVRKDLETLASATDDELRQAHLRMVQLAEVGSSTQ